MTTLFNRVARLTILPNNVSFDQSFRIQFSINKLPGTGANSATITIYNLNETQRSEILKNAKTVLLDAGYVDDPEGPPNIAIMDVMRAEVRYETPDIAIAFECMDGASSFQRFVVSESYAAGYTVGDALARIASKIGRPLKYEGDINVGAAYRVGSAFSGRLGTVLDQIVARFGGGWRIEDGTIIVTQPGAKQQVRVPTLREDTGLLRKPSAINDTRNYILWRAESLLNHRIKPGRKVRIESDAVTGEFTVDRCTHAGDTRGNQWTTTMELRQ